MKKFFVIAFIFLCLPLFAAEDSEIDEGDVTGRDLDPVVRGFFIGMEVGTVSYIGDAGDYSETFGSVSDIKIGYDMRLADTFSLGFGASVGILQIGATKTQTYEADSPWTEDYSPIKLGGNIMLDYLITERFEIGMNISIDYLMASEACESGSSCSGNDDPSDGFLTFGGGFTTEYYTYARHFSIGLGVEYFYVLNFEGMNIQPKAFLKYSF